MADPTLRPENLAETLARVLPDARILFPSEPKIGDMLQVIVPKNSELRQFDMEQLLPNPRRTKGVAHFSSPLSFVDYVERFTTLQTLAWCDFNPQSLALRFDAVMDDHAASAPGWRGHRAVFEPQTSREWKTWQASNGKSMSQVDFAEFVQDNQDDIVTDDAKTTPTSLQMMTMATDFIAQEDHVFKSSVRLSSGGVRLTYVADADKNTVETMQMFERFAIGIPVFQDGVGWRMGVRLKYRVKQGAVTFFYELTRPDRVHGAAAAAVIAQIQTALDATPLLMGVCP
jgi:uncharacterized protein YfdQ (DUF2303 family)